MKITKHEATPHNNLKGTTEPQTLKYNKKNFTETFLQILFYDSSLENIGEAFLTFLHKTNL